MSLVLYRKYRPKTFSEVIGQEHVVKTLTNAILSGIISHAYLFYGPRGSGKTTIARLLAKALNCEVRSKNYEEMKKSSKLQPSNFKLQPSLYEPCNKCSSCLDINEGRALDLIEIDAASHRGIDEIRELRDGIRFVPTKSKYKVFIVDESHQLTKEAANALLKTLEEPPDYAIFILATTEIHKMIPTIVSRCQRFDFRRLTVPEIIRKLEFICQNEKIEVEKPALELIALNASGSFRDAESLLDQALTFSGTLGKERKISADDIKNLLGLVEINLIQNFVDLISQKNASGAINFLNEKIDQGLDLQEFARALINYLRQAMILKTVGVETSGQNPIISGLTKEEFQKLQSQTEKFSQGEILKILNLFLEAETKMKYSPILQLPLELAIIEILQPKI
jgi:DNA polymerase-3 subunit gamma/tau